MFRRFLLASVASNFRRFGNIFTRFKNLLVQEEDSGNANVFYNPQDLTSLRVETNGSGGYPAVGDSVGMMLDTSGLSGSMEEFLAAQPELVTNGTFDADVSGWSAQLGAVITYTGSAMQVQSIGTNSLAYQFITADLNKLYALSVELVSSTGGTVIVQIGAFSFPLSVGVNILTIPAGRVNNKLDLTPAANQTVVFDNISVKEIPGYHAVAPTDAARPTLMDDPDTTWASLTDDGTRGEELVTNGGFDGNVTGWQASGSATVSYNSGEDAAEIDVTGSGAGIRDDQTITVEPGSEYEVTAVVKSGTYVGDINYVIGGVNTVFSLTGDYVSQTRTITATTNDLLVQLSRATATTGTWYVQSISVRKVNTAFDERGPELVDVAQFTNRDGNGTVFIDSSGVTVVDTDGGNVFIVGNSAVTNTKWYEYKFTVTGDTITFRKAGQPAGGINFTAGVHSTIMQADGDAKPIWIWGPAETGTLTDISVKEVPYPNLLLASNGSDDDSTFDTNTGNWDTTNAGWSIGSGVLSCDGTAYPGNTSIDPGLVQNRWYLCRMYISAISGGQIRFNVAGTAGTFFNTTGWKTEILRAAGSSTLELQRDGSFVGSIDNVIIQELPSTTPTSYYLDCDGTDDWMEVTPTLNLGEQWWHTGAWISDSSGGRRPFATSNNYQGAPRDISGDWVWYDPSSVAQIICTSNPSASKHVLTIEQSDTNGLSARFNGVQEADPITPYDDSAVTQGVALFSQQNNLYANGWNGRFYGGAWGQGQVDYDELTTLQDYLGTLVEPDIDPTDVTKYDDVYQMLSAQTAAALFDIDDTTSLRTIDVGLQTYRVPVDGDPVNLMADVSKAGGLPFDAAQKTVVATLANWSGGSGVDNNEWTQTGVYAGGTFYTDALATAGYYKGTIEYEILSGQDWSFYIRGAGASPQSPYEPDLHYNLISGGRKTITFERLWDGSGTSLITYLEPRSPTGPFGTIRVYSMTLEHIPGYVAVAASSSARPTLASVLDETASELTDDGTRGEELVTSSFPLNYTNYSGIVGSMEDAEIGAVYELTYTITDASSVDPLFISASGSPWAYQDVAKTVGTHTYTLRAQDAGTGSVLYVGVPSGSITFSGISVRKVNTAFDERGDELITNGTFDTDTTGWSPLNGSILSVVDGKIRVTSTLSATYATAVQGFATEVGKVYEATTSAYPGTNGTVWVIKSDSPTTYNTNRRDVISSVSVDTERTILFTATATTTYIHLLNNVNQPVGAYNDFDNISVKEVASSNLLLNTTSLFPGSADDNDSTFDTDTGNWTKGVNNTISGGLLNTTATSAGYNAITLGLTANAWYKVQVYVTVTTGTAQVNLGGTTSGTTISATGWFSDYIQAGSTHSELRLSPAGGFTGSWDNVSLQEVPESVARQYYLDFDGPDDNMILDGTDFGSSTNATLYKTFRGDSTDTQQIMFGSAAGPFALAAHIGSSNTAISSGVGSPVYREDGTIPSYVDRGDVFTALIDNTDHTIGVEEADLSASATWTSSGFYIGKEFGSVWDNTGRLYAWAAVDTRLDGRNRDLLENFMISRKSV
jgi:hypothetical protein